MADGLEEEKRRTSETKFQIPGFTGGLCEESSCSSQQLLPGYKSARGRGEALGQHPQLRCAATPGFT